MLGRHKVGARQSCSFAVGPGRPLSQMSVCLALVTVHSWACPVAEPCQPRRVGNVWLPWADCVGALAPPPPLGSVALLSQPSRDCKWALQIGLSSLFRAWGLGRGEPAGSKPSGIILSCQTLMAPPSFDGGLGRGKPAGRKPSSVIRSCQTHMAPPSFDALLGSGENLCLLHSALSPQPSHSLFSSPRAACANMVGGSGKGTQDSRLASLPAPSPPV